MGYETVYDENGKSETVYVQEEPDCPVCCDSGRIPVDADGEPVRSYDPARAGTINCADCNPTEAQHARRLAEAELAHAEYERRVAAGEITYEDAPF